MIQRALYGCILFLAALCFCIPLHASAESPSIRIYGEIRNGSEDGAYVLTMDEMQKHGIRLKSKDPNFPSDAEKVYTGIALTKMMELCGAAPGEGVTMAAIDQYITYMSRTEMDKGPIMIAFESDGKPIHGRRGGPFKLIHPPENKTSPWAYVWYIKAVYVGAPTGNGITIQYADGKTTRFSDKELVSMSQSAEKTLFAVPDGFRGSFPCLPRDVKVDVVPMARLLGEKTDPGRSLALFPQTGSPLKLDLDTVIDKISIGVRVDGGPIHPTNGGPYCALFTNSEEMENSDVFPTSGSMFFIEKIEVR